MSSKSTNHESILPFSPYMRLFPTMRPTQASIITTNDDDDDASTAGADTKTKLGALAISLIAAGTVLCASTTAYYYYIKVYKKSKSSYLDEKLVGSVINDGESNAPFHQMPDNR